jgi:carbamoyl-phosphate synthase large subunit
MQQIKDHTKKIALGLRTVGLINVQFAIKDEIVYIIEANPRASRTVPFIAKAYGAIRKLCNESNVRSQ